MPNIIAMEVREEHRKVIPFIAIELDKIEPGWATRIDVDSLDMQNAEFCVAGQLGRDWMDLAGQCNAHPGMFAAGQPVWIEEIEKRVG